MAFLTLFQNPKIKYQDNQMEAYLSAPQDPPLRRQRSLESHHNRSSLDSHSHRSSKRSRYSIGTAPRDEERAPTPMSVMGTQGGPMEGLPPPPGGVIGMIESRGQGLISSSSIQDNGHESALTFDSYAMEQYGEEGAIYDGPEPMEGAPVDGNIGGGEEVLHVDNITDNGEESKQNDINDDPQEQGEEEEPEHSETAEAEARVRKERKDNVQFTANSLESILKNVQGTVNRLLQEIDSYLSTTESVRIDYIRCQASQRNEAQRLEEMEPDVAGATASFLQQAQMQFAMGIMDGT